MFPYLLFVILACMWVLGKMLTRSRGETEGRLVFGGMLLAMTCLVFVSVSTLTTVFGRLERTQVVEELLKQRKVNYVRENVNR